MTKILIAIIALLLLTQIATAQELLRQYNWRAHERGFIGSWRVYKGIFTWLEYFSGERWRQ